MDHETRVSYTYVYERLYRTLIGSLISYTLQNKARNHLAPTCSVFPQNFHALPTSHIIVHSYFHRPDTITHCPQSLRSSARNLPIHGLLLSLRSGAEGPYLVCPARHWTSTSLEVARNMTKSNKARSDYSGEDSDGPESFEKPVIKARETHADDTSQKEVNARFANLFRGSKNIEVPPSACIPWIKIREKTRSGIERLKALFLGLLQTQGSNGGGIVAGMNMPIVVPLTGIYRQELVQYFKNLKLSDADTKARMAMHDVWYGVIDGGYRLLSIMELIDEYPSQWGNFRLFVTCVAGGYPVEVYEQLAMTRNELQSDVFHIETTLYDRLKRMKIVQKRLTIRNGGKTPKAHQVTKEYDGSSNNNTLNQTSNTAARLHEDVIDAIGVVMQGEHPNICARKWRERYRQEKCEEAIMKEVDCRVFRKFINLTSMKSSKSFMTATSADRDAQVNTVFRARSLAEKILPKAVGFRDFTEQFLLAKEAIKHEKRFLQLIERSEWPSDMLVLRTNLLQTNMFDEELKSCEGNGSEILPSLLESYRRKAPSLCAMLEEKYKLRIQNGGKASRNKKNATIHSGDDYVGEECGTTSPPPQCDGDTQAAETGTYDLKQEHLQSVKSKKRGPVKKFALSERKFPVVPKLDALLQCQLYCYNKRWQDWRKEDYEERFGRFDIIFIDPAYNLPKNRSRTGTGYDDSLTDTEAKEFSNFAKSVMKPGCYVLIWCSWQTGHLWETAMTNEGFETSLPPTVVVKDVSMVQMNRLKNFPQNSVEFLLVFKSAGDHPDGFTPDFASPFQTLCPGRLRRWNAIVNVPVTRNKLTHPQSRSPVRVEEKNVNLLTELMDLYSPPGSRGLDVYAGTLTSAIAALRTKRSWTVVESDKICFDLAKARLVKLAEASVAECSHPEVPKNKRRKTLNEKHLCPAIHSIDVRNVADGDTNTVLVPNGNDVMSIGATSQMEGTKSTDNPQDRDMEHLDTRNMGSKRVEAARSTPLQSSRTELVRYVVSRYKGQDKVLLLIDDVPVGTGILSAPQISNKDDHLEVNKHVEDGYLSDESLLRKHFARVLHNAQLKDKESESEVLVSVRNISVYEGFGTYLYEYPWPGHPSEAPGTLDELYGNGFYAWDLLHMKLG